MRIILPEGREAELERGPSGVRLMDTTDSVWRHIQPAEAGEIALAREDRERSSLIDGARAAGYKFVGLDTPGQLLGRRSSPAKAAAAHRAAAVKSPAKAAASRRAAKRPRPKAHVQRPPVEPVEPPHLRNPLIRARRDAGESFGDLAHAFGLSRERVRQICLRGDDTPTNPSSPPLDT